MIDNIGKTIGVIMRVDGESKFVDLEWFFPWLTQEELKRFKEVIEKEKSCFVKQGGEIIYALEKKKEEKKMATNVKWVGEKTKPGIRFGDLSVGEYFQIESSLSKGAVYQKVLIDSSITGSQNYAQLEVATGKIFASTNSNVRKVEAETTIYTSKPPVYN